MDELKTFTNDEFGSIRTTTINGEPWFVGKDVAEALGYSNTRDALSKHVDNDDKNTVAFRDGTSGNPITTIINESGLYSLILGSKLPSAKRFKKWVTAEVLPSIRKHGAYMTDETLKKALESPDFLIQLATELKNAQTELAEAHFAIENMKPKASYYDVILNCRDLVPTTVIAKDYGMSARKFNRLLHDLKVQFKQGERWFLYTKWEGFGYTQSKTDLYNKPNGTQGCSARMCWTQKGRMWLYDFLKEHGIRPVIELELEEAW
jgi:prophage antirepressor-like protein